MTPKTPVMHTATVSAASYQRQGTMSYDASLLSECPSAVPQAGIYFPPLSKIHNICTFSHQKIFCRHRSPLSMPLEQAVTEKLTDQHALQLPQKGSHHSGRSTHNYRYILSS